MNKLQSVHLQDFPNVSNIEFDSVLVDEMDLVKEICSTALFLRDKENLRVRLPLNQIKIIGQDIKNLEKYKDIIADEINVKNVVFENNLNEVADYVLEVDLKKLGAKYGSKLKDIMIAVKSNNWKQINDKVEIAGIILNNDEYTIKLKAKNQNAKNLQPLSNNKALIELDLNITPELELEGFARDIVRLIQQDRKEADLNLSDKIALFIDVKSDTIKQAIEKNAEYIKKQTLANNIKITDVVDTRFKFKNSLDDNNLTIGFDVQ